MTLPAEGTGRSTQQPLLPLPGAVCNKILASQGCSPVPGLSLGLSPEAAAGSPLPRFGKTLGFSAGSR